MDELLTNIINLTKTHLHYKVKYADVGDKEDDINYVIAVTLDKLLGEATDIIGDAEEKIDDIMEKLNEEEENRIERQKDFNVYKYKKRGDLGEYL